MGKFLMVTTLILAFFTFAFSTDITKPIKSKKVEKPNVVYIAPDGSILPSESPIKHVGVKPARIYNDAQPLKNGPQKGTSISSFTDYISYADRPYDAGFIFGGDDSVAVWFRPVTQCSLLAVRIDFNADAVGRTYDIEIHSIKPELDGTYDFSKGTEAGANMSGFDQDWRGPLMGHYSYTVAQQDYVEIPIDLFGLSKDQQNIGLHDFAVSWWFNPEETGANEAQLYGDVPTPFNHHGFKYYHAGHPALGGAVGWVGRYNFSIAAKVLYYGDPPPVISGTNDLPDVYNSLNPGPYTVKATVSDLGTDVFTGYVRKVGLILDNDDDPYNAANDTVWVYDEPSGTDSEVSVSYDIPNPGIGNSVYYSWIAYDNGAENAGDPNAITHTTQTQFYHFTVREKNPNASILLVDDSFGNGILENYTSTLDALGYIYDLWVTQDSDTMSVDLLNLYSTVIWFNGVAQGGILSDGIDMSVVAKYLDNGGNFFFSSSDYVGIVEGNFDDQFNDPTHPFVINYLKVSAYRDDANTTDSPRPNSSSQDTLYRGIDGTIMEGVAEFESDPIDYGYNNWNGEMYATDDATDIFSVYDVSAEDWNDAAGIYYNGNFKMIFIPWCFDYIADGNVRADIIQRILKEFGENASVVFNNLDGSRYGVVGNGPFPISVEALDSDGSVASVELGYAVDGSDSWNWIQMTAAGDNKYVGELPVMGDQDTMYTYTVRGTDDQGSTRYYPGTRTLWRTDHQIVNTDLLYMGENPYDWYTGDNVDPIMTQSLDNLGYKYDVWDVDDLGMVDAKTVLSQYKAVLYCGYADWNEVMPRATVDNPFTEFINNNGFFIYSTEEMLGTWENWGDGVLVGPGDFAYDVLGVGAVYHDWGYDKLYPYQDSFANAGIDSLEMDTVLHLTNYSDFIEPRDGFVIPFLGNAGGTIYYASTQAENMLFFPFCIARLKQADRDSLLKNIIDRATSIEKNTQLTSVPTQFDLKQNYPNPFNPVTTIEFSVPKTTNIKIAVYNVVGEKVRTLVNSKVAAGHYKIKWDGLNDAKQPVASGVYIYRIESDNFVSSKKMILMK